MSDVKWVKLAVNIDDDEKIKIIETLPERDAIRVIWEKLLCQAAKCNDGGYVYLTPEIPYSDETLAAVFNRPVNVVRLALETFKNLAMVRADERGIFLVNFEKHQNLEGLELIKENERRRVARYRDKIKQLKAGNVTSNVTETSQSRDVTVLAVAKSLSSRLRLSTTTAKGADEEKELHNDELGEIARIYEDSIGILTPQVADELKRINDDFPPGWFAEAVKEACLNNARRLNYIIAILERWKVDGYKSAKPVKGGNGNGRANGNGGRDTRALPKKYTDPKEFNRQYNEERERQARDMESTRRPDSGMPGAAG